MPRCHKCSKCTVPLPEAYQDGQEYVFRTWSNWPEITSKAATCDLCLLMYHHLHSHTYDTWRLWDLNLTKGVRLQLISPRPDEYQMEANGTTLARIPGWRVRPERRFLDRDRELGNDWVSQARLLLEECQSEHTNCGEVLPSITTEHSASLPRRLLDISDAASIRVIDTAAWISQGLVDHTELVYCTLSYRWPSDARANCVLKEPFDSFIELSFEIMPQTFKDAITIARGLAIRFLWIDALCIVQPSVSGNSSDWHAEGPRMGVIYHNAVATIAATCVQHFDDGFLDRVGCERTSASPCAFHVKGTSGDTAFIDVSRPSLSTVTNSSLNQRGWVAQERFLSRRILHFTTKGVFWECLESSTHGTYGSMSPDSHLQAIRDPRNLEMGEPWRNFVSKYSMCEFSNHKDRLVALSSITKVVHAIFPQYKYCAGLWESSILDDLLWVVTGIATARLDIAPTWSWASLSSSITFYPKSIQLKTADLTPIARVLSISMRPSHPSNPYGDFDGGALRIHGMVISYEQIRSRGKSTSHLRLNVMSDNLLDCFRSDGSRIRLESKYRMIMLQARDAGDVVEYFGLLIEPLERGHGTTQDTPRYQRLGLVVYHDDSQSALGVRPSFHTVSRIFGKDLSVIDLV